MEKSLDSHMLHQILDSCACGGGKEFQKQCEKIGKEIAGMTLNEKINHINNISPDSEKISLNADNTLSVILSFDGQGKHKCACSSAIKKGMKVSDLALGDDGTDDYIMPLSYCICCAGSSRRTKKGRLPQ